MTLYSEMMVNLLLRPLTEMWSTCIAPSRCFRSILLIHH